MSVTVGKLSDGVESTQEAQIQASSSPDGSLSQWSAAITTIDWGDGNVENAEASSSPTAATFTHMYTDPGNYNVKVTDSEQWWENAYPYSHYQNYTDSTNVFVDEVTPTVTPKPMLTSPPPGFDSGNLGPPPTNAPPSSTCPDPNKPVDSPPAGNPNDGVDPEPAVNAPIPGVKSLGFGRDVVSATDFHLAYTSEPDIPVDDDGDPYYGPLISGGLAAYQPPHLQPKVPYLIRGVENSTTFNLVGEVSQSSVDWFVQSGSLDLGTDTYSEKFDYHNVLKHGAGTYTLTEDSGEKLVFNDFTHHQDSGHLVTIYSSGGGAINFSYNATGGMTEQTATSTAGTVTTEQSFVISYLGGSDPSAGEMSSVMLRRKTFDTSLGQSDSSTAWTNVQQVAYSYYGSGDSNGEPGQLETATIKDGGGNAEQTYYYRYWTSGSGQPDMLLKSYLGAAAYAQASAALPSGTTPMTATDSQLAPYVDRYYEYDSSGSPDLMVAQGDGCSSCSGGQGTYTYSYATNSSADSSDYNSWALKTTITLPDGTVQDHYYDTNGLEMLAVTADGTSQWGWPARTWPTTPTWASRPSSSRPTPKPARN